MKITLVTLTLVFGLLNLSKGQTRTDESSKVPEQYCNSPVGLSEIK